MEISRVARGDAGSSCAVEPIGDTGIRGIDRVLRGSAKQDRRRVEVQVHLGARQ